VQIFHNHPAYSSRIGTILREKRYWNEGHAPGTPYDQELLRPLEQKDLSLQSAVLPWRLAVPRLARKE